MNINIQLQTVATVPLIDLMWCTIKKIYKTLVWISYSTESCSLHQIFTWSTQGGQNGWDKVLHVADGKWP